MIITIDGPAGTGKTTVAQSVAKRLGFDYFDSGAMYRSIAWFILKNNIDTSSPEQLGPLLQSIQLTIQGKRRKRYFVNQQEVTDEIRSEEITKKSSQIAKFSQVRQFLIPLQRQHAKKTHIVFEGRDMGTVVFPRADCKIYLTASDEVRAERRTKDLYERFPDRSFSKEKILQEIKTRDQADESRKISPLRCPDDAFVVDTSDMSIHEVVDAILHYLKIKKRSFWKKMKFFYCFFHCISLIYFKIFYRLKVYGKENIPIGSGVLASNHTSYYDPAVIGGVHPEEIYFLAKKSLFSVPVFRSIIKKLNSLPVSRGVSDLVTLKKVLKVLAQGKKIIIFPEGERSYTGQLNPLLPGLGFIIYSAQCPLIPIYIHGAYEMWKRDAKGPKFFGKIVCVYGRPIYFDFSIKDKKVLIKQVEEKTLQALKQLQAWCQAGCKGSIPS